MVNITIIPLYGILVRKRNQDGRNFTQTIFTQEQIMHLFQHVVHDFSQHIGIHLVKKMQFGMEDQMIGMVVYQGMVKHIVKQLKFQKYVLHHLMNQMILWLSIRQICQPDATHLINKNMMVFAILIGRQSISNRVCDIRGVIFREGDGEKGFLYKNIMLVEY